MSKRELAAQLLGRLALGRGQGGAARLLAYHRIVEGPWDDFVFDEQIISATPQAFEAQMRFAAKNFDVLSFADLDSLDQEGKPWPRRALVVTFDDGYRDNYIHAFPILRNQGLPATVFLATGHIGQAKIFWWDAIAWCFKHSTLACVTLPAVQNEPLKWETRAERRSAIDRVLNWAKSAPEASRQALVDDLPARLGVDLPEDLAKGMHLSWDEVREMARGGIEFGSHTVTHPILNQVDAARLQFEACESKSAIERELGKQVLAFAYPAGTRKRRDENAQKVIAACGYRFAVVYDEGVEVKPDRALLPRIHVDRDHSLALFRANLLFPGLMLRS